MSEETMAVEEVTKIVLGDYGWLFLVGIIVLMSRSLITNIVASMMIRGPKFSELDIIFISGRKAMILNIGIRKTSFYMYDRQTLMIVPNEKLNSLTIEVVAAGIELPDRLNGHDKPKDEVILD
jgi:hypothetical protein